MHITKNHIGILSLGVIIWFLDTIFSKIFIYPERRFLDLLILDPFQNWNY